MTTQATAPEQIVKPQCGQDVCHVVGGDRLGLFDEFLRTVNTYRVRHRPDLYEPRAIKRRAMVVVRRSTTDTCF